MTPPLHLFVPFVGASLLLIAMPGPNAVLIMARTLSGGQRAGFATLLGTWSGAAAQLAVVVAGLTAIAATLSDVTDAIRPIGAAYLVVQGAILLLSPATQSPVSVPPRPSGFVFQGFLTGVANPKSLIFYGAFLPQFVSPDRPAGPQLVVLAITFLALALPGDSVWVFGANSLKRFIRSERVTQRLAGGLLVGVGARLALVRRA